MNRCSDNIITSRSIPIYLIDLTNNIITSTSTPIPLIDVINNRSIIRSILLYFIDIYVIDVIRRSKKELILGGSETSR